eukprot:TRINITY_DN24805_c0_g1_i1.p1 TRINITY_DN24805_c0_g1~~TRINITY_DN24805_c0_g1_i1.p1  ORF type:complete len:275 (+),score=73.29 TRINITY_DN24805_c0_g1_i1:32-826(+)
MTHAAVTAEASLSLADLQSLRCSSPEAAAEALGEAVRREVDALGSDVHPKLGPLWLEYGCTLLELVERGADESDREGEGVSKAESEASTDTGAKPQEGDSGEDVDGDLQVAWECLEIARQCFEPNALVNAAALARCHGRLADLLMMQGHNDDAVDECQAALRHCRGAKEAAQAPTIPDSEAEEALATTRLVEALMRSGRQEEARQLAARTRVAPGPRHDAGPSDVGCVLESSIGFAPVADDDREPAQVPVRKRRRTEGGGPEST